MVLTKLYSKVNITKPDGTLLTLGMENIGHKLEFNELNPHTWEARIADSGDSFINSYVKGSRVEVFVDTNPVPTTKVFRGLMEVREREWPSKPRRTFTIMAIEEFWVRTENKIIPTESFFQKKAGVIVRDLFNRYYSAVNTTNVLDTDATVDDFTVDYQSLKSILDKLAEIANAQWFTDPDLALFFYPRATRETGITIAEDNIVPVAIKIPESLLETKNSLWILGGEEFKIDQQQLTGSTGIALDANFRAVSFTPAQANIRKIEVFVDKLGAPSSDLLGSISEDNAGPTQTRKLAFSIRTADISAVAGFVSIPVFEELIPNRKYWLIVDKVGTATDTYRWYHNAGTTNENAFSADGVTWTVQTSSFRFAFKEFFGDPVVAQVKDVDSIATNGGFEREGVFVDRTISSRLSARLLGQSLLSVLKNPIEKFDNIRVRKFDTLPRTGHRIRINLPTIGFDKKFNIKQVRADFTPGLDAITEINLVLESV